MREAFRRELPPCDGWTEVNIHDRLFRMVAMVSGRIFVGPEVYSTDAYIDNTVSYVDDVVKARTAVDHLPAWLRRFKAPRLPEIKRINELEDQLNALIGPVAAARKEARKHKGDKPDDLLQWLIDEHEAKDSEATTALLVRTLLNITFAALHTTTMITTHA